LLGPQPAAAQTRRRASDGTKEEIPLEIEQHPMAEVGAPTPTLWARLQQRTAEESTSAVDLWAILQERLDPALKKPKGVARVEVSSHHTAQAEAYYVLNNPEANAYLKVDARDYYLWGLMDGEHSVSDLAMAYYSEFGAYPFERLPHLLAELEAKQLVVEKPVDIFEDLEERFAAHTLAYRLQRFSDRATQREFSLKNIDGFFDSLYRRGGWLLFTRPAVVLYTLAIVAGLAFFVRELLVGDLALLSTAGSFGLGLVILLLLNYVMTFFHECGHALTCKHYGRHVPKGGLMLYMGAPAFFVDTTDIWMAPKRARILTSLAGPFTTLLLGSLVTVVAGLLPSLAFSEVLFKAALIGYAGALMNVNPLLELDGYYALVDWLEIPMLRKRSLAFIREELPAKLSAGWRTFSREQRIFVVFGILAAVWTIFFVVMAAYMWDREIAKMDQELVSGRDILPILLVGGLMLLAGTNLVLGLIIKALLLAGEGARRVRRFLRTSGGRAT
jgi:putative peptide zinc metalloprotease protein